MIRTLLPAEDVRAICEIYNFYILHTVVTFENEPLDPPAMEQRVSRIASRFPFLVYERDGGISGYCYADTWRDRSAYVHTVETTIYLENEMTGRGIGSKLYKELINQLHRAGFHAAVASITLPNSRSVALHEKFGFRKVAHFPEVGSKFGKWLDVGFWELCF